MTKKIDIETIIRRHAGAFKPGADLEGFIAGLSDEIIAEIKKPVPSFRNAKRVRFNIHFENHIERVCRLSGYSFEDLRSKSRYKHLTAARAYFIQEIWHDERIQISSTRLGLFLNKDHSTILHAVGRDRAGIMSILGITEDEDAASELLAA